MAAIGNDPSYGKLFDRNVLLMSPSTLLFVVRTVAHLWRQERQKQNVQDIVNRGAELYDKLVGFVDDLNDVGTRLEQAKSSYGLALSKLSTGKGNVIRQAEMLKAFGVKPKKSLPTDLVDASAENEPLLPEQADAAAECVEGILLRGISPAMRCPPIHVQVVYCRSEPPNNSTALTICCDQVATSSSRSVRSADWKRTRRRNE